MGKFRSDGTSVDANKDINLSTRYDDRELIKGTENQKLDELSDHLEAEVTLSSNDILKMERLQERYYSDGLSAKADKCIGYWMRYVKAYEHLNILISSFYLPFIPVTSRGKQSVFDAD